MDNTSARPLVCLAAALAALAALAVPPPPAPGREAWTFRQDLAQGVAYHAREAYRLVDGYGLVGALETVAADLARYFASAARPSAKTLALARGKVNGPESYRVDVAANGDVTLTAEDDDGIRRAAYPDFPRSHPISTFPKRITDKMGANADRFAGYCLRKTGKFV